MLEHGGRLRAAAARYGIPINDWLDLSTGINPYPWPVPMPPASAWSRLPEPDDGLLEAAQDYYGSGMLLPVAGSQAAIQALPKLRARSRVGVLTPGYAEHGHAWRRAGHDVFSLPLQEIENELHALDVLVLIQPNNPTGSRFDKQLLLQWHEKLAARNGWLVVDEAFIDTAAQDSLVTEAEQQGLVVLRSLGKFFGLAGIRVGFVFAQWTLLDALENELGPWTVTGPARYVARQALVDFDWQAQTRQRLTQDAARLHTILSRQGLTPSGGTELFQWVATPAAEILHHRLAEKGILTRLFTAPASLRFGLPYGEPQWQRLEQALAEIKR